MYSIYYNPKFFNIPEFSNESTYVLLDKFHYILRVMELDSARFCIDTIHRLPSNGHGPRPVILKFISKLDRDLVWSKKALLGKSQSPVYIREHFDEITEKNIRKLLPIR